MLFASDATWKRKPAHYMDHVWQYQLHLLKTRHVELARAGREKRDVHAYVWHALCAAHAATDKRRADIVRHMVGDFKRYSLMPQGRKDGELNEDEDVEVPVDLTIR